MRPGTVYLVGAGPGDPELLTLRARRLLESADVVLYDRLVDRRILAHVPEGSRIVYVGKAAGEDGISQDEVNDRLISEAAEGRLVVRLKGGDPFLFGRGAEEAEALESAGVPFEVVPGVTSGIAAPAYAGIPLTHRRLASSVTFVTGNEDPRKEDSTVAWDRIAQGGGTVVVLMGFDNLAGIVETLVRHGRDAETPAALIRWGTEPYQQTVVGTLSNIVDRAREARLEPPVVTVIGDVVPLRERLAWFEARPLWGKRVLVTRTRAQAGVLSELLAESGALPIELPTIQVLPPEDWSPLDSALRSLDTYNWTVFTSVNGVEAAFDRLAALGLDTRAFGRGRVAAIGPATAESLQSRGISADLVPETFLSEALASALIREGIEGARVLLPRADIAGEVVSQRLARAGATVEEVTAYRTVASEDSRRRLPEILADGVDIAAFTSSSTATNLADLLDGDVGRLSGVTVACIGPSTATAVRNLGLEAGIVAIEHTVPGLVRAIEDHFTKKR